LAFIVLSRLLILKHILNLPFRVTNETLNKKTSVSTLDFLMPGGTYLDETITISEVIKSCFTKEKAPYERVRCIIFDLNLAWYVS
jgi:hypothetical protein